MLLIYFLLLIHSVLSYHNGREKKFYNVENVDNVEQHFDWFMNTHNKTYHNEEERAARLEIFKESLIKINEMNKKDPHSTFGINQFADLTTDEFLRMHTGLKSADDCRPNPAVYCTPKTDGDLIIGKAPTVFDWRDYLKLQVKFQMTCGSCWAFATTGNIEALYQMKYQTPISLSEQQLLDCDSMSCEVGGYSIQAFRYLIQTGGIQSEESYPYINDHRSCKFNRSKAKVKIQGCFYFNLTNEKLIKDALVSHGPLTASVDGEGLKPYTGGIFSTCNFKKYNHAVLIVGYGRDEGVDGEGLKPYTGGIFSTCNFKKYNHAVLIVGYGRDEDAGKDYWVIKNSWGKLWGEGGYVRIARGVNECGISSYNIGTAVLADQ